MISFVHPTWKAPLRRLPHLVLFLTVFAFGVTGWSPCAVAQDLDDVPTPEDLELGSDAEPESRAPLRIEQPGDGDDVETPFTVAGTAPAGARLELWLDDELQRVFKADSSGKFTTPVNEEIGDDTTIWIHQVADGGERVQSGSVRVNWSGQADAKKREFAGEPARPEEVAGETSDEDLDVFSEDVDAGSLTTAPPPPAVEDVGKKRQPARPEKSTGRREIPAGGFSEMGEEPESESEEFEPSESPSVQESVQEDEAYVYRKPPPSRLARGAVEAAAGFGGGAVGVIGGGLLGLGLGLAVTGGSDFGIFIPLFALLGAASGGAAGISLGVIWAGNALDGNGSPWGTIGGEVAGFLLAGAFTAVYVQAAPFGPGVFPALAFIGFPVLGAVFGYELTSDPSRRAAEAKQGIQAVRPIIAPATDGRGMSLGLGFRF